MNNFTSIRRIVPNIYSNNMEKSKMFYTEFLEMKLAMDMGWMMTFVSKENSTAQISIFDNKSKKSLDNSAIFLSVEVADVNQMYRKAQKQNLEITYPIVDEPWEVRRFFVKDPNGVTLNILSHL